MSLNPSMRSGLALILLIILSSFILACGGGGGGGGVPTPDPSPGGATLITVYVTPASPSIKVGETVQLTAEGFYSDANYYDRTSSATWSSDNEAVATVSSGGLVTGVALGSTVITATFEGKSDWVTVSVTNTTLPSGGEGTVLNPVLLQLGDTHRGQVGTGPDNFSYYYFQADITGDYVINLWNNSLGFSMFEFVITNSSGTQVGFCANTESTSYGCAAELTAGVYYLRIENWYFDDPAYYDLLVEHFVADDDPLSPVELTLDVEASGMVNDPGAAYFTFTTDLGGSYLVNVPDTGFYMDVEIYNTGGFGSEMIKKCYSVTYAIQCRVGLEESSTYYVKVLNDTIFQFDRKFKIGAYRGLGDGTINSPVSLTVGVAHDGGVEQYSKSYYSFQTTQAGSFVVSADVLPDSHIYMYSDASFSTLVRSCYSSVDWPCGFGGLENSTTYYFTYENNSFSGKSYSITVSPGNSEGSVSEPFTLEPEVERSGTLDAGADSYFVFTPLVNGVHHIGFVNSTGSIDWRLYSDASFTTLLKACATNVEPGVIFCSTPALDTGSAYYLKVQDGPGTFTILITSSGFSEGSTGTPIALALDTPHGGGVDSGGASYYTFTTSEIPGDYDITLTGQFRKPTAIVYSLPSFSGASASCGLMTSGKPCTVSGLLPETQYYLEVTGHATFDVTYDIEIAPPWITGCLGSGECLDMESGVFPSALSNGTGNSVPSVGGWSVDTSRKSNGSYSLVSDVIGNFDDACFDYTPSFVTNAISFNSMTDSEGGGDYLEFYIDGVLRDSWSGLSYWEHSLYFISNSPGYHTYSWCYVKDNNGQSGADAAWVDDISSFELTATAYDFNDGTVPAGFVNSGYAYWSNDSGSLVSGSIGDYLYSCIATTDAVLNGVSFDLAVDSELNHDYLMFYIDGSLKGSWSGLGVSQSVSYSLSAGTHTFKWCYDKDGNFTTAGADAAWIDNLVIY